jgi:hypothetical protein
MATYKTIVVSNEKVDHRWHEPYLSASGNRKVNGIIPTGRYRGFVAESVVGEKKFNLLTDPTHSDSVAVYEKDGYQQTIRESSAVEVDGDSVSTASDITVAIVIRVSYDIDTTTSANIVLIDNADILSNDIIIAKATIPSGSTDFDSATIVQDEVDTTRPYSTGVKDGFMAAKYIAEPVFELITIGVASVKFQLNRSVYIGNDGTNSQNIKDKYFALLDSNGESSLYGTDGLPIYIEKINNSADSDEVNPSTEADTDGFYSNPWIYMDFSETGDVNFTGNLQIWYGKKTYYMAMDSGVFIKSASPAASIPNASGLHRGGLQAKHIAEPTRVTQTLAAGTSKFQFNQKVYIGKTDSDTQFVKEKYFRLLNADGKEILLGTDGGPIYVDKLHDSGDSAELDPSSDADADGFYENPWVYMDFTETGDTTFTGDIQVWFGKKSFYSGFAYDALVNDQPKRDSVALSRISGLLETIGSVVGVQVLEHDGFTFNDPQQRIEWASTLEVILNDGRKLDIAAGYHDVVNVNENAFLILNGETGEISDVSASSTLSENFYVLAFFWYDTTDDEFDTKWDLVRKIQNRLKNVEISVSENGAADFSGAGCLNRAVAYAGALINHSGLDIINVKIKLIGDVTLTEPVDFDDTGYTGVSRISIEGFILNNLSNDLPRILWSFASGDAFLCTGSESLAFKNIKFEYSGAVSSYGAIKDPGAKTIIEKCFFDSGSNLNYSVYGTGNDVAVRDCYFINQVYGIELGGVRCLADNCYLLGATTPAFGTAEGIRFTGDYGYANNCYVDGFGGDNIHLGDKGGVINSVSINAGLNGVIVGSQSYIANCRCEANGGAALIALNGDDGIAYGNHVIDANTDGIALSGKRCRVIGNYVNNSAVSNIHVDDDGCVVEGNTILGGVNGIEVDDYSVGLVEYVLVANNYIENVTEYGIYDNGCRFPAYIGNQINTPGYDGCYIAGTTGILSVVFSGNEIVDPGDTYDGFGVAGTCPAHLLIADNYIYRTGSASGAGIQGLDDGGTSSKAIVCGNKVSGFSTGIDMARYSATVSNNFVNSEGNGIEGGEGSTIGGNVVVIAIAGFNGIIAKGKTTIYGNRMDINGGSVGVYIPSSNDSGSISSNAIQGASISINIASNGWTVSGNYVEESQDEGIKSIGDSCSISNNYVHDTNNSAGGHNAIDVSGDKAIIIGNNIDVPNGGLGVSVGGASYVVVGNNFGGGGTDASAAANKEVANNIDV